MAEFSPSTNAAGRPSGVACPAQDLRQAAGTEFPLLLGRCMSKKCGVEDGSGSVLDRPSIPKAPGLPLLKEAEWLAGISAAAPLDLPTAVCINVPRQAKWEFRADLRASAAGSIPVH
jgi:hypothetical protein